MLSQYIYMPLYFILTTIMFTQVFIWLILKLSPNDIDSPNDDCANIWDTFPFFVQWVKVMICPASLYKSTKNKQNRDKVFNML